MLRKFISIVENLLGGLLVAATAVAWRVILQEGFLTYHLREQVVLTLVIWVGAFAAIEAWEEGIARIFAFRRDREAIEKQILNAADEADSRLNYHNPRS